MVIPFENGLRDYRSFMIAIEFLKFTETLILRDNLGSSKKKEHERISLSDVIRQQDSFEKLATRITDDLYTVEPA